MDNNIDPGILQLLMQGTNAQFQDSTNTQQISTARTRLNLKKLFLQMAAIDPRIKIISNHLDQLKIDNVYEYYIVDHLKKYANMLLLRHVLKEYHDDGFTTYTNKYSICVPNPVTYDNMFQQWVNELITSYKGTADLWKREYSRFVSSRRPTGSLEEEELEEGEEPEESEEEGESEEEEEEYDEDD
jgi:hypothetical protein